MSSANPSNISPADDETKRSARLVAFLSEPSSYSYRPQRVRLTQTHISWVFVASPLVFKVKKPVNFGFLDFSSLDRRHHFCLREVELNRRLAAEVYEGVVPIYQAGDWFSFEPNGEIVEYCVRMKELKDGFFLHQLLEQGSITDTEINRVISQLRPLYASAAPPLEIEGWGTPEKLRVTTDENLGLLERFAGKTIAPGTLEAIRLFTNNFYLYHVDLLNERVRQKRIRDCHGDLRLDHIHLTAERVTIFDCIEFNDRLRFIDLANDLAFLAMDFDFANRPDLANILLENASREFGDNASMALTNFYKCYRAAVRGKVESIEATSGEGMNVREHHDRAQRYFSLALRYAACGSQPTVLVVMGPVGSGKTNVAQRLATELGWPVFSSDRIRKSLAGVPLAERTRADERERIYSEEMTTKTYQTLLAEGMAALRGNGGVVLDATFSRPAHRRFLLSECAKVNARLQVIELQANRDKIQRRLQERDQKTEEVSDARLEDLAKLDAAYEPPVEFGPELIKVSTNASLADAVTTLLIEMAKRQAA